VKLVRLAASVVGALGLATSAFGQPAADVERLELELASVAGELERIEQAHQDVPDLFAVTNRDERATWGAIYHLNKEYTRASLALFGAVEPRPGEDLGQLEGTLEYAESLFFLADSLYELGNIGAARVYFERLLRLRGHAFYDDAILRLMAIASTERRFDDVDSYYAEYLAVAGRTVPGQVRYLRAKNLFVAGKDEAAVQELSLIPTGEAYDLRARYLRVAVLTRTGKLTEALGATDDALKQPPTAPADDDVLELLHLARARLLYELDRLDESIDAYQEIGLESRHLSTMLYEVTLTYVRRGQLGLRAVDGDGLSNAERQAAAGVQYKKALRQLDDLRALEPDGDRATIDLLAGNLTLQLQAFDDADDLFADVKARFRAADEELTKLAADASVRDLILKDMLALEADPYATLESPLPALAARRAAKNRDVARGLQVFKELRRARAEVDDAEGLLGELEAMLATDNPARAELFSALRSAVERSQSVANAGVGLRTRALDVERKLARPSPEAKGQLEVLAAERAELEARYRALPQTADAIEARRKTFVDGIDAVERIIHELELTNGRLRAGVVASVWVAERELAGFPMAKERTRQQASALASEIEANEVALARLFKEAEAMRRSLATMGGRSSGEEQVRVQAAAVAKKERDVLATARDPAQGALLGRLDAIHSGVEGLIQRNAAFRDRLDGAVEERLVGARAILSAEREAISAFRRALVGIDSQASSLREQATGVALDRVRREISEIVLRADVGTIDTAFARKQKETEHIGALQRARALELTDLTQAYADLTRDELP